MTKRLELPKFQAFDSNGDPLSGGLVYTYAAGTTTLKTTYSDYDASTANTNPVVLDSRGEADIYVQGSYKIVLKDSAGATIWTLDNVQGGVGADASGEDYYYPDATAADQGVTGNSDTIKYAVDTISTDNGTIYLKHDGGTATTTYTLTTSDSISEDINIIIENGAILDGAGTLTLDNPDQIIASPSQQIFGSSITVVFTNPGTICVTWFGANPNSTDSDQVACAASVSSSAAGSKIYFPGGSQYYNITDSLAINKALVLYGDGESSEIRQATDAKNVFAVTVSNVAIRNLYLRGTGSPTDDYVDHSNAIDVAGTDGGAGIAPTFLSNIKVDHCHIYNWKMYGIKMEFVQKFELTNNHVETITYAGIGLLSCKYGRVSKNLVEDIKCSSGLGSGNGYGIFATRQSGIDTTRYPRSQDITISSNNVIGVETWEGLDTHGGLRINFIGNTVHDCKYGIAVVGALNAYGSEECNVVSNAINSNVTDGTAVYGISFAGDLTNAKYSSGSIVGNTITGYGLDSADGENGSIYINAIRGLSVNGNTIINSAGPGIALGVSCYGFSVTGNTIIDVWSELDTDPSNIRVGSSTHNYGNISGNSFHITGASEKTYVCIKGIYIENQNYENITIGKNYSEAPTYIQDFGAKTGRGYSNENTVTSGTGEDDLKTITVTSDIADIKDGSSSLFVGVGENMRVIAAGTKTNANSNKTIKFYFGSTSFTFNAAANDTNDWRVEAMIHIVSSSQQRITWVGYNGATVLSGYEEAAETMSGDIVMKVTGQCAHASDVITQKIWIIEKY